MKSLELIRKLVGFDTTSREPNRALIEFVRDYLLQFGIASELIWNAERSKANLWATIGPPELPGVILSGHTDVVPVDGQDWSSDPFTLREADGRLYGRGTADMKGFIAIVLALVPEMAKQHLAHPIHLAFSYDEEIGCSGVQSLIAWLNRQRVKPQLCLVGEPTDMRPIIGHKGGRAYQVHVRGTEAHSSLAPLAVNAVEYAAELIVFLKGIANEMANTGSRDDSYDIIHSTLQTGMVHGGTAINIVPHSCEFVFEFRHLPGVDPDAIMARVERFAQEQLEPRMQAVNPETGIRFSPVYAYPALNIAADHPAVRLLKSLVERNDDGKVAFGTEGGLFQGQLGIPTIVCGPGSITQAHKPDEYVSIDQVLRCETLVIRLINRAAQNRPLLAS
jgi:acetylornithine deacetylase